MSRFKAALGLVVLTLAVAGIGHLAVITAVPYREMDQAMARLSRNGANVNAWAHGRRATASARKVVRPSPDLANSACVYDLSDGPIRITAAAWDGYMSVSVFAANSDNYFVVNDREAPNGVDMILYRKGEARPSGADLVVESPSVRGVVLQRRLAPTPERFAAAAQARAGDVCAPLAETVPSAP